MKVLVTGASGFIGSELVLKLLHRNDIVVGIDNHNEYYDQQLKEDRLSRHAGHPNYTHYRVSLEDGEKIEAIFQDQKPDRVVNLAAQAGVRYSLENPKSYINSNLVGFGNILEGCRHANVEHLVYASSSSVYGSNTQMPFSIHDNVNHPVSLYAATKKANELMAHTYSHLYNLPTTGLRFFTVYGPWDRPDMALQKFAKAIMGNQPIQLYNYGNHRRDFTYIDDIIQGIMLVLDKPALPNPDWDSNQPDSGSSYAPWRIYNIGNNHPVELKQYITELEKSLGKTAEKEFLPLQPGDVPDTFADVEDLVRDFGYQPRTGIEEGVANFAKWFKEYYKF
jgi:UDP-glucuronate 4-epimerase